MDFTFVRIAGGEAFLKHIELLLFRGFKARVVSFSLRSKSTTSRS